MKQKGKVYFVGAGPGDASLITVRGAELLGRAEVVVFDAGIAPGLLDLAAATAELIRADRTPVAVLVKDLILARAREGKSVVRLLAGDPYAGEASADAEALSAEVSLELVPGVVGQGEQLNWLPQRPLHGRRIVVTRSRGQANQLTHQLAELGAEALEIPTIRFVPPTDRERLADALLAIGEYEWLVFTSPNGVTTFFDYFLKGFEDIRAIGNVRFAAVGPGTAAKLKELHLRVDVMPEENLGRKIAEAMHSFESVENLKILLVRAEVAASDLPKALEELGAIVDDVPCYKTIPETEDRTGAAALLLHRGADWITFTSASTVQSFHARFDLPKLLRQFPQMKLASIGPETTKAIAALELQPAVEARQHTIEGLVNALTAYRTPK